MAAEATHDHYNHHYNRSGLILFSAAMGIVCLFFIYLVAIHPGVDLKELPTAPAKAEQK